MSEGRISPYSLNDLKNTTDDALGNYLRGLNFKQDNSKLDVRLALGYVAVVIAGATFAADYKLGWEATRVWTAVAVAVYVVLNSALTYWMYFVEKGLVFEGERNGHKTKKHDPTYYLEVSVTNPGSTPSTWQIKAPFTTWFTSDGFFVSQPFQKWLATTVEVIGDADLKNASRDERDELAAPTAHVQALDQDSQVGNVTGSDATKGSKKTKRKN
ncbi:related to signal peptidase 18 KD subunit [Ramularia collo-cygni]|uniref:Signal peptidase complex subunit 2 n=1 Tax=Ramularia collo-cygni TaxID=112498 RepID=A0A2D3UNW9_9PEZI|nr:related to signal peptidase 18 KD subunit [Ramularia collo-cygni]CZT16781.1 related to signal peptidase 18 KD subunit [Ramularia collo-cygni]